MEDPATPYLHTMCLVLKILRVLNQKHLNIRENHKWKDCLFDTENN